MYLKNAYAVFLLKTIVYRYIYFVYWFRFW